MKIPRIWELFPKLVAEVKKDHEDADLVAGGHDFDHGLRIGDLALRLAWRRDQSVARVAGVAGVCQQADRVIQKRLKLDETENMPERVDKQLMTNLINSWLNHTDLTPEQRAGVIQMVVEHNWKPNADDDPLVVVAVADAVRVVNMDIDVIVRTGQHHHDLPVLNPVLFEKDPTANYKTPKTVLWDLANTASWANLKGPYVVRLPEARNLALERAKELRKFFALIKRQRRSAGLIPYPEI